MTFKLVRMGWPNTAAILALAIMPIVALTAEPERHRTAVDNGQAEAAAICPMLADCPAVAAVAAEIVLE
jgi:hypothetical protein